MSTRSLKIMHKITSRWGHQNSLSVMWNLGKRCNYDCSYCPASIHDNHSPHTDIEILKNTVDKICETDRSVRFTFTGGEPTVHPGLRNCYNILEQEMFPGLA